MQDAQERGDPRGSRSALETGRPGRLSLLRRQAGRALQDWHGCGLQEPVSPWTEVIRTGMARTYDDGYHTDTVARRLNERR